MHKIFRYPKFSETFKGCPRTFFGTVRPKIFDGKTWYPLFHPYIFFETKNFLKNSRIFLRKFWALWDIKISTGNRDMPPLIHKFFSIPENFRKTEGFLYKAFRFGPVRQKFRQNRDAPSSSWKFSIKEFFWSTKVFSIEIFQYSETKIPTENRDTPPPLIQTFSIPEIIATIKDSPTKFFDSETKNFRRKILIHPPFFSPNFFGTRS